jgi:hypothetical protein
MLSKRFFARLYYFGDFVGCYAHSFSLLKSAFIVQSFSCSSLRLWFVPLILTPYFTEQSAKPKRATEAATTTTIITATIPSTSLAVWWISVFPNERLLMLVLDQKEVFRCFSFEF